MGSRRGGVDQGGLRTPTNHPSSSRKRPLRTCLNRFRYPEGYRLPKLPSSPRNPRTAKTRLDPKRRLASARDLRAQARDEPQAAIAPHHPNASARAVPPESPSNGPGTRPLRRHARLVAPNRPLTAPARVSGSTSSETATRVSPRRKVRPRPRLRRHRDVSAALTLKHSSPQPGTICASNRRPTRPSIRTAREHR